MRSPRIAQARVRLATDTLLQTPHRAGALCTGYALIIAFSTHLSIEQTVASRVAEEVGVKLGEEVGYTIRFEDQTNPVQSSFTPYTSFLYMNPAI